jgi:hypothetical protein
MQINLYHGDYAETITKRYSAILAMPPMNIGAERPGQRRTFAGVRSYYDSMPEANYQESQREFLAHCYKHLEEGGRLLYHHKDRRQNKVLVTPHTWIIGDPNLALLELITLVRTGTHNHNPICVWPMHDYIFVLCRKEDVNVTFYRNNDEDAFTDMCKHPQSSWWTINFCGAKREGSLHDGPMPLPLAYRLINKYCRPNGTVCDPYMGIGTTMEAALRLHRNFEGAEIKKEFYDEAVVLLKKLAAASHSTVVKSNIKIK